LSVSGTERSIRRFVRETARCQMIGDTISAKSADAKKPNKKYKILSSTALLTYSIFSSQY